MLEEGTQTCLSVGVANTLVQLVKVHLHPCCPDTCVTFLLQSSESTVEAREEAARALANLAYSSNGAQAALEVGAAAVLHKLFQEVSTIRSMVHDVSQSSDGSG